MTRCSICGRFARKAKRLLLDDHWRTLCPKCHASVTGADERAVVA
ncbi:MAG: hypothetical protein QXO51_07170 [Halobacteria archaeon]